MERLLARLERRFGSLAIPNLIVFIVGGMGLVWFLSQSKPELIGKLTLDLAAVRHGEVWRLITFLFIPPMRSEPFWFLVNLYFTWWVGSSLEQHWGAFKFNAYFFLGVLTTIVAAAITGAPMDNSWLGATDGSLFLAFATTFPEAEILLLFILPIRVKWIGMVVAAAMAYFFVTGNWAERASILAAVVAYAVFFADFWVDLLRQRRVVATQRARRARFDSKAPPALAQRTCAICGASEAEGADIRVCSCEKCGGKPRTLCLDHARNH